MPSDSTLAIIGTAGRKNDAALLAADPERFAERMLAAALKVADRTKTNHLVSGGAAWADHVAVWLFLSDPTRFTLQIEAPAPFVTAGTGGLEYADTGERDFIKNPGGTSNHYLRAFADTLGLARPEWSPFIDFALVAGHPRATIRVTHGFQPRNLLVAQSTHALAMTFGGGRVLQDGGTAKTMTAFLARPDHGESYHLDLGAMRMHAGAQVGGSASRQA